MKIYEIFIITEKEQKCGNADAIFTCDGNNKMILWQLFAFIEMSCGISFIFDLELT